MTAPLSLGVFVWRATATHVVTYFLCGLAAFALFDYPTLYASSALSVLMRPTDSAWVAAGPALQLLRGLLFGVVLWPLAPRIAAGWRGGLALYGIVAGLAVFGAAGPAPGSLEGLWFTTLPLRVQLIGLPEVVVQTAAFAFGLAAWCHRPARWVNVLAAVGLSIAGLASLMGVLSAFGVIPKG